MQVQQSIASLIGGAINDIQAGAIGLDAPPPEQSRGTFGDRIRRSPFPSWLSGAGPTGAAGGINGLLAQILSLLQQLISAVGGQSGTPGTSQYFDNAQASSTGDPHLAFDGTTANGTQQSRFDSMDSHADLLDSNSFAGGFRISTDVTRPDANGITSNRRADVITDFGSTRVSLDNDGNAQVVRNGKAVQLATGQSMRLGPNERLVRNGDGSLVISERNAAGAAVTTTLRRAGAGVDVSVDAHSVNLGGDLVRHR